MKRRLEMHDLDEAMRYVTYLPGWHLRLYQHGDEGPGLQILVELDNSYQMGSTTLDIRSVIPPCHSFEEFYNWLHWRLGCIALHERSEWFKVHGKAWIDPHGEGYTDAIQIAETAPVHVRETSEDCAKMGEEVRHQDQVV